MPIKNDCPKDSERLVTPEIDARGLTSTLAGVPKRDRWKDAQAVVNLVAAAEDFLAWLDHVGTTDEQISPLAARLRIALKAME